MAILLLDRFDEDIERFFIGILSGWKDDLRRRKLFEKIIEIRREQKKFNQRAIAKDLKRSPGTINEALQKIGLKIVAVAQEMKIDQEMYRLLTEGDEALIFKLYAEETDRKLEAQHMQEIEAHIEAMVSEQSIPQVQKLTGEEILDVLKRKILQGEKTAKLYKRYPQITQGTFSRLLIGSKGRWSETESIVGQFIDYLESLNGTPLVLQMLDEIERSSGFRPARSSFMNGRQMKLFRMRHK